MVVEVEWTKVEGKVNIDAKTTNGRVAHGNARQIRRLSRNCCGYSRMSFQGVQACDGLTGLTTDNANNHFLFPDRSSRLAV